jgi:E3 ubiquitin-protein ligase UBR2
MQSKTGTGDLVTFLHNHWKLYVPLCLNAQDSPKRNLIDKESDKILMRTLEAYLCNSYDAETVLDNLKKLDDPPQLCGRVFKNGEPSYFCRDCGSDPTCVLCSYCFRRSKHRNHRYKMMTSAGGGYCDCGDPEAWKHDPYCDLHMPKENSNETTGEDYLNKLPTDLIQRATELFSYLLEYLFEVLSIESNELPSNLKPESSEDDYVTMLYNDEIHSYDQVINTLKKVLSVDDKGAFEYAAVVDKEGRSTLKRGKKDNCDAIKSKVEQIMGGSSVPPLATKVMHHSVVAHQYFAEKLIIWLQKICGTTKGLKHLFCKIGLFAKPDQHSVIEKLMLHDTVFWKSSRALLHQFYISTYFMDPAWKKEFSIVYIKNYKTIWINHIKNADDTVSLTDLTVQIFTVTSLSKYLIANHNLLQSILETLFDHCKISKNKKLKIIFFIF